MTRVVLADSLEYLRSMPDAAVRLIYVDPPFNTGEVQTRARMRVERDPVSGDRTGFAGTRYRTIKLNGATASAAYADDFEDYVGFLGARMAEARRVLTADASLFMHLDWREVHYVKVML